MTTRKALSLLALALALLFSGCAKKAGRDTAVEKARYDWYLTSSAGDYLAHGKRDPKWDTAVLRAFTNLANGRLTGELTNIHEVCPIFAEALNAGCDDPLVRYWQLRCENGIGARADADIAAKWTNAAVALDRSGYSPIRKFYGMTRAVRALRTVSKKEEPVDLRRFRQRAEELAREVLSDPKTPAEDACLAVEDLRAAIGARDSKDTFMEIAEPLLAQNWPKYWRIHQIIGESEIDRAWGARGNGFADTVSDGAAEEFLAHLNAAEKAFHKAWDLEEREQTAVKMITVELGQGLGCWRMEKWFKRAMAINPNSFDAVSAKYHYLRPQWHGSFEEQRKFALECVESKTWGGRVPLLIVDYHRDAARYVTGGKEAYFANPAVWADLRAGFEKYFTLNPDDQSTRKTYFWYAYTCGQWTEAQRQLALMGNQIDYTYFGGQSEFQKMTIKIKQQTEAAP